MFRNGNSTSLANSARGSSNRFELKDTRTEHHETLRTRRTPRQRPDRGHPSGDPSREGRPRRDDGSHRRLAMPT